MDTEEFIRRLRSVVGQKTAEEVVAVYERPPGRSPSPRVVALSNWYAALKPHEREMVQHVAEDAAHAAVFGTLCVLDGVRRFDLANPPGTLELWYVRGEQRVRLNRSVGEMLHDAWNAV
jgi:hypothetical protein